MISFEIELVPALITILISGLITYVIWNFWEIVYWFVVRCRRPERMKRLGSKIATCYTRYYPWTAREQKPVLKFKEMAVTEQDIKNLMYGSIRELTRNRSYYYDSSYRPHWTEEGKKVVGEMLDLYAEKITQAIKEEDDRRSKEMVMNALKEESK